MRILLALLELTFAVLPGCTASPHYIGSACRGADGPGKAGQPCGAGDAGDAGGSDASTSGVTFAVDLDHSGVSFLSDALVVAGKVIPASLRLRGEAATRADWPAEGAAFRAQKPAVSALGLAAPFTDETRAVGLATDAPSYVAESAGVGAVSTGDFAVELVLRVAAGATVLDERNGGIGWAVRSSAEGALVLEVQDATHALEIASEPLVPRAWYHCLFWVSRSAGGRVYCNGRESAVVDVSSLGNLESATTPLTIGGSAPPNSDAAELALFELFAVKNGEFGPAEAWPTVSRTRFAALTGVSPSVAAGSALSRAGSRDSSAYLDLQQGAARSLFLVGPDWPRVTCRTGAAGTRDCGYLSEPKRTRWLEPDAAAWKPNELTVATNRALFADGAESMAALIPSAGITPHTLAWTGTYGGARQAFSFFVRAEAARYLAVSVSTEARALFDLRAGTVLSAPAGVRATLEPWGAGLSRCAAIFQPDPGASTYQIEPLGDASGAPFAGDGSTVAVDIAGLQLDVGTASAGSLLASSEQAADALSFVGNDGNVPGSSAVAQTLRVLLPPGPRLTDQALSSLNLGGEFDNQVQLYVTGDTGQLKFWGLAGGATHWAFDHPASFEDGLGHSITAAWDAGSATLSVDGVVVTENALIANDPPFLLDRIDVGFSSSSSGSLEGLVAGLRIAEKAP